MFDAEKALIPLQYSEFTSGQYPTCSDISFTKAALIMYYCKRMSCLKVMGPDYIKTAPACTAIPMGLSEFSIINPYFPHFIT